MKPFMQDARAHENHQHLIVGNARAFIHRFQAVQKADNLLLIEEGDRLKHRPAQRILHKHAERSLGFRVAGDSRMGASAGGRPCR